MLATAPRPRSHRGDPSRRAPCRHTPPFNKVRAPLVACLLLSVTACSGQPHETQHAVHWHDPIEVATGPAYRGPWRMNESQFLLVDDSSIAITENGTTVVIYGNLEERDIFLQIYDPTGTPRHETPVNISHSPNVFSWLPRVVVEEPDASRIYVLWQEIVFSGGSHGGEIFFARSIDGGKTFSPPINLSNTTAGAGKGRQSRHQWHNGSLDIVRGHGGLLYAAWTEFEGPLWLARSDDDGATFSSPALIAGGGSDLPGRGPSLALSGESVVYLAWTVGEDSSANIRLAVSQDQGLSFEPHRKVHPGPGLADAPKIAVCADGVVHLVYGETRGGRRAVFYARSTDGGRTFEERRTLSGNARAGFPSLAVSENQDVVVTWELFPGRGPRSRGLGYAVSRDGGATFSSPAEVPGTADAEGGTNGSQQGLLMRKLAMNESGALAVVNSTFRAGDVSRVLLLRGVLPGDEP